MMRCHFVFTVKRNSDGSVEKFKARFVADGNTQKWGIGFDKVFSTVAKLSTLRLVLILAAAHTIITCLRWIYAKRIYRQR